MPPSRRDATPSAQIVEEPLEAAHLSLRGLYTYWLSKKGDRIAPSRAAILPEEIGRLLPNIALFDVIGHPPRFRCRLFGTGLVAAYGQDMTGRFVDEVDLNSLSEDIIATATKMVVERRAQVVRVHFAKDGDGRYLEYQRIGLPLSQDGHTVNIILCGFLIESAFTA